MIENIVIGKPIINIEDFLSLNKDDWENNEKQKTYFTNERYLPRILTDTGIMKSASEVRRNRKDLNVCLDELDFIKLKIGKKFVFIVVGN